MKLQTLEIENFGLFTDQKFEFSDSGFQLVFGTNEAGKSTLLQLIRELLFGFATRNAYAFADHAGEMAASAAIEMSDGTRFRFRRRKGRLHQVVGRVEPSGPEIDAAGFARMLGVASADLYEHVFGFSLTELSLGEKSLQDANLNEALYGGGLGGLANFQNVQDSIQKEADELFSPAARRRTINELLNKIKQTKKELREAATKPRDYENVRKEHAESQARAGELRKQLEVLTLCKGHLDRLFGGLDPWLAKKNAQVDLDELSVPERFPADGAEQLSRLKSQQRDLAGELDEFQQELSEKRNRLARIQLAPEIVRSEAEIRQLGKRVSEIEGFRRDIPLRQQRAEDVMAQVLTNLRKLNPQWDATQLEEFATSLAQRDRVERLEEEFEAIDRQLREFKARRPGIHRDLKKYQDALAKLAKSQVSEELESIVDDQRRFCGDIEKFGGASTRLQEMRVKIQDAVERLNAPIRAALEFAEPLPVPMSVSVSEFRQQLTQARAEVREADQELAQAKNDRQTKQQEIAEQEAQQTVPHVQQLRTSRETRDTGWALIRRKYIEGEPVAELEVNAWLDSGRESLADGYQRQVAAADRLADERQAKAEAVAKLEQLNLELERVDRRVKRAEQSQAACQEELDNVEQQWRALWGDCTFEPLSPEAMWEWLRDYDDLRDQQVAKRSAQSVMDELQKEIGRFEARLRAICPDSKQSTETLLAEATAAIETARNAKVTRKTYESQIAEKQTELGELDAILEQLDQRLEQWQQKWSALLDEFRFPASWDVRLAGKILNGLGEARSQYDSAQALDKRVMDMSTGVEKFVSQVLALCQSLATDLASLPAEDAVNQLTQRLDDAKHAERDQQKLTEDVQRLEARTEVKRKQLEDVEAGISELFAIAGVESDDQFHNVARLAERRSDLLGSIRDAEQQLRAIRGTEEESTFFEELQRTDKDSVMLEQQRADEELQQLDAAYTEAMNAATLLAEKLRRMEAAGEVSKLALDLESAHGALASAIDRWAPLVLAQSLMKRAITRFEQQHQPAMLDEVRKLFSRLTDGRYVGIERKLDAAGTLQVVQHDGCCKEPDELSTGTREQLYLAIRLAYIKQYCREAEPLPIVMDDVLVNFDADRARRTLEVLNEIAADVQILFMTCHQHMVELVGEVLPGSHSINLSTKPSASAAGSAGN